ncbi:MAG: Dihydroorotate dehydrogenase B (NAD(+)), electron transfer subunit [bacterium]|nr:Dihydroorotate dehydrogenase B (NAD(+)), electron transfer subunit [bacterium]
MTLQERCRLKTRQEVAPGYFLLTLESPAIAPLAQPGQFVHLLTDPSGEMLRRPLSIQDARQAPDGSWELEILFAIVGEGTRDLAERQPGDLLDCLGPLGHPWPVTLATEGPIALIGGGVGVPPLVYLAKRLAEWGIAATFYQGARRADLLLMTDRIRATGATLALATDDGSAGHPGRVTELLPPVGSMPYRAVFACGPLPMLQAIARWAGCLTTDAPPPKPVWLSFENKMGCAVGACLGCVLPMRNGRYDRVCTEGPIFAAQTVDFQRLVAL